MENSNNKNIVIGVIVLLFLALLVAWWVSKDNPVNDNLAAVGGLDGNGTASSSPATIVVNDQFAGTAIFVSEVRLPNGGWVVIKKDNNGRQGDIVGAGYFDQSVTVGEVVVPATSDGEKYFAILYRDNGDKRFTLGGDSPILDPNGELILSSFQITSSLPEIKG